MKILIVLLLFSFVSSVAHAQVAQGCPTCKTLFDDAPTTGGLESKLAYELAKSIITNISVRTKICGRYTGTVVNSFSTAYQVLRLDYLRIEGLKKGIQPSTDCTSCTCNLLTADLKKDIQKFIDNPMSSYILDTYYSKDSVEKTLLLNDFKLYIKD